MKSGVDIKNQVKITISENGKDIMKYIYPNITCKVGRTSLAKRLIDFSGTLGLGVVKYIAVGDDNSTPTENDTILTNEIARQAINQGVCTFSNNVVKVYATFPVGTSLTIKEAGLFIDNTSTSTANTGTLLCHSAFGVPINKTAVQAITIEWTVSILNS